jgi:hypothetical protein
MTTPHTTEEWFDGQRYADTAHLPPDELAQTIAADLADPYGLPHHFTYQASADTTGVLPHLLIHVSGITTADGDEAPGAALITVHHVVAEYARFRFERLFPRNVRFEHTVVVTTPDGRQLSSG